MNLKKSLKIKIVLLTQSPNEYSRLATIQGFLRLAGAWDFGVRADIHVPEVDRYVRSDDNDCFEMENFPPGRYSIKVKVSGFHEEWIRDVTIGEEERVEIPLEIRVSDEVVEGPATCPICRKSDRVIPLVYGYPSPGLLELAGVGRYKLGGCCLPAFGNFHCTRDDHNFFGPEEK